MTEKNETFEFGSRAYLKEIYDSCFTKRMVVKKAGQIGVSTFAIAKALWLADNHIASVIMTMPTQSDVSVFSQTRVNPMIRRSRLQNNVHVDNVGVKQVGDSFIYLRGAWSEKQALSIPSDFNIHDELDRSKPDVREMYEERLSASRWGWNLDISTPTYPNYGITALFEETDRREWFVKCESCGKEDIIREENILDGEYRCLKCKEVLNRRVGRWRATGQGKIKGYHVSQLMADWISAREVLRKKTTYRFKRDYYNFVLGEEYAGGEGMVTRADIINCFAKEEECSGKATIGVDWGNISWYVLRKSGVILGMGMIKGDTRTHAGQVGKIMERFDADAVCDFGYGDTKNSELMEKYPGRVWVCQYPESDTGRYTEPKLDYKTHKILVDRTRSLQDCLLEIKNKEVRIFNSEIMGKFIEHHLNLVEEKGEDRHGSVRTMIKKVGDDHLAHANNYARMIEGEKGQPNVRIIGDDEDETEEDW